VIAAGAVVALGPGPRNGAAISCPLGLALLIAVGLGPGALTAFRRLRFQQEGEAPGIVRVTEAQIAYYGPRVGGFVGLPDLSEIRLLTLSRPSDLEAEAAATASFCTSRSNPTGPMPCSTPSPRCPASIWPRWWRRWDGGPKPRTARVIALNEADRLIWSRKGAGWLCADA
jgi:hypothetical protein